jgi:hypothetical protein
LDCLLITPGAADEDGGAVVAGADVQTGRPVIVSRAARDPTRRRFTPLIQRLGDGFRVEAGIF